MPFAIDPDSITHAVFELVDVQPAYHRPEFFHISVLCIELAIVRPLAAELSAQTLPCDLRPATRTSCAHAVPGLRDSPSALYQFAPSEPTAAKIVYVANWLTAQIRDRARWLSHCDHHGRPQKLLAIKTLDDAVREADKFFSEQLPTQGPHH